MHERIDQGANLLKNNVFQFGFWNDEFFPSTGGVPKGRGGSKLPQSLQDIINDEEKRKKLVIYINPPYAKATSTKTVTGTGKNKCGVTTQFKINELLKPKIGNASNKVFALFMANIYVKIPGCRLGQFSKLKFINGSNFKKSKENSLAEYVSGFIVLLMFNNVKGKFPIGFTIWNTAIKSKISTISTDVFDKSGNYFGSKKFYGELPQNINRWIKSFDDLNNNLIGLIVSTAPDFQHDNQLCILSKKQERYCFNITFSNLIKTSIYFSVRNCIEGKWLNDRDQYTFPIDGWQTDKEFQNNCLAFTLFNSQNKITSSEGTNHWIPFTEYEVNAQAKFASNFMTDFIKGKIQHEIKNEDLFSATCQPELVSGSSEMLKQVQHDKALVFSEEATAVFDAGRELWKYYHSQPNVNVNASLYDIRAYFQGRNDKGRMNSKSDDAEYMKLITQLRSKLTVLADAIKPKVYEYGFLKE